MVTVLGLGLAAIAVALVAVVAGACLQGSLGFGLGLLAAPVLVLLDPRLVPGPVLCLAFPLAILVAWRERQALDLRGVRWAVVGRLPGTAAGALIVTAFDERWIAVLFAASVLGAVGLSVIGLSVAPTRANLLVAGFVSGTMGTATSIGGPPMGLIYQGQPGPTLRGSLAAFMLFGASFSLAGLVAVGAFTIEDLGLTAVLIPGVLVGFALSRWTNRWLDRGYTRPAVLVFAAVAAVSILIRQLA